MSPKVCKSMSCELGLLRQLSLWLMMTQAKSDRRNSSIPIDKAMARMVSSLLRAFYVLSAEV
jgi:hypothetical protein